MTTSPKRTLVLRKTLFGFFFGLIVVSLGFAVWQSREWVVPEEAKKLKNPLTSTDAALTSGRTIYLDKCAECHGETGQGDGPEARMYDPAPGNLTDTKHLSTRTDGELFYQISEGHRPMPAFKKRLSEEQRWQLVLFVRSLGR
jgi:mono/diheme cytochrome c family protein